MSKKVFALVSTIICSLQAIGVGLVTYFEPANATAINSAIVVGCDAIVGIMLKFVEPDPTPEK